MLTKFETKSARVKGNLLYIFRLHANHSKYKKIKNVS